MDVSNTVDVTDPQAVAAALRSILAARYPGFDFSQVDVLVGDFSRLYRGEFPGYKGCDVSYHNMQHVLDVTLAMARLIGGHDGTCLDEEQLGPELALTGIACALFHDSGYIARRGDNRYSDGGAYTRVHVSRSARFMSAYLPSVGLESILPVCKRIVHFTGYELNPASIKVKSNREYMLGSLLGTADLIAQIADVDYLNKCRDSLYLEFVSGGIAGDGGFEGHTNIVYRTPQHLLELTPDFIQRVIDVRLEGYFKGVYRYAAESFNGVNLYMEAIDDNRKKLERMLASN